MNCNEHIYQTVWWYLSMKSWIWHSLIKTWKSQALQTASVLYYTVWCPCYFVHPCVSPVPAELTLWTATWLQAPGAAPQSTTLYPGCRSLNLSSISSSLKALLHRKFWAWEALTYGSLSCRCSQRCSAAVLLFVNFFNKHREEWRDLLWKEKHHIVLTEQGHEERVVNCACVEIQLAIGQNFV